MALKVFDIMIIGGGPIGLYAAAAVGETGASCILIESRPQLGGTMRAIYPDKNVYNFPGVALVKGRDLIIDLENKISVFGVITRLGEYVYSIIKGSEGLVTVKSNKGEFHASSVLLTTGLKAYYSSFMDYINISDWDGTGVYENWPPPDTISKKNVAMIIDTQSDQNIPDYLCSAASGLLIISREALSEKLLNCFSPDIETELINEPWILLNISGTKVPEYLIIKNKKTSEERKIKIDLVIGFFESRPRQTLFSNLGIETVNYQIKVDPKMQTSMKGVYAAGDIAHYPGKVMLLSAGIYEAKIAVKNALKLIRRTT
jgi:ferredoxin/flavodoxin---NADP+ reductase